MFKRYSFFTCLVVTATLVFPCFNSFSQTTTQSKRITKPVTIDGSAQEWINPFGLYESKTKLMFAIANDDITLYLCFQCPDPVNQDKIMQAGMQVSISTKGKNKLNAAIQFPLKKTDKKNKEDEILIEKPNTIAGLKAAFLLNNYTMLTNGFKKSNGLVLIKESKNILLAMNWDSINTLVYEIAIPFSELVDSNEAATELNKEFTLEVEIFAVSQPDMENFNIKGLNSNNAASVVNSGAMQNYGGTPNGTGNAMLDSYNGMGMMNGYPVNGMAGMTDQQTNAWDGSSPPQYRDISGMFEKTQMKQKFLLTLSQ
ncbi:MAG: hypothetical protein POELPBGB_00255 [Bacteroidia bacterium]|nr:hypothetical protein [Bacteroidia bacterium]